MIRNRSMDNAKNRITNNNNNSIKIINLGNLDSN